MSIARQQQNGTPFVKLGFNEIINQLRTLVADKKVFKDKKTKYIDYSKNIQQTRNLDSLYFLLHKMLGEKLYPNEFIISQLIKKLNSYKRIDYANAVYNDATLKDVANEVTHNSMIDAASKNGRIDLAEIAYKNATDPNKYVGNVVTHTSMIDAAGKNGRIDLAEIAYKNATDPSNYVANEVTHNSMIDAGGKNNRIDLAEIAYKNATDPNNYVADVVTHNSMIDALSLNNKYAQAKELYKASEVKLSIKKINDIYTVDLHGLSYGSAYISLKEFIESTKKPLQMTIIYGKGLHSKSIDDEHPIKKATKQLMKDIQQDYEISFQEVPNNSGCVFCSIKPKLVKKSTETSNKLSSIKPAMNPNASSFKPKSVINTNDSFFTTKPVMSSSAAPFIPAQTRTKCEID